MINAILFQNKEINDLIFMLCTFENSFFMNFIIKKMLHFAYYFLKISGTWTFSLKIFLDYQDFFKKGEVRFLISKNKQFFWVLGIL
jgi:hypothetical protein